MEEQTRSLRALSADLEDLRGHLTQTRADWKEAESKLRRAENDLERLSVEADPLKSSVSNWAATVAQRNKLLLEASTQAQRLVEERIAMTGQYNTLAEKYNRVVEADNTRHPAEPSAADPP